MILGGLQPQGPAMATSAGDAARELCAGERLSCGPLLVKAKSGDRPEFMVVFFCLFVFGFLKWF